MRGAWHFHTGRKHGVSFAPTYGQYPEKGFECLARYVVRINYPGQGNRSILYPYSLVGNTLTFDVVEDTGSNLTSSVSSMEALARAPLNSSISLAPEVLKRSG